ncbi:MAG TPA: hypothetical protein VGJ29_01860 [Vicinamibacterales bacterium]
MGHVDAQGRVRDSLRLAIRDGTLSVPEAAADQLSAITAVLRKIAGRLEVRDADKRRTVKPRRAVLESADFKAIWDRIKYKTAYRVRFDNEHLIETCIKALHDARSVPRARLQWRVADLAIGRAGVEATEREGASVVGLDQSGVDLPDILTELEERTRLTRKTIQRVLSKSERLEDFTANPQAFMEIAAEVLIRCKQAAVVSGIKYERLGSDHFDAHEVLDQETVGYIRQMIADSEHKSAYDHIVYDSEVEAEFARRLELDEGVKFFTKLPPPFVIQTPLGPYNPDWAVIVEQEGRERLYFVAETKGSLDTNEIRASEAAKIECGRAHFDALRVMEPPAKYVVVRTVDDLMAEAT